MGLLRIAGFSGMWPIRDPRGLPDNAAVEAVNIRTDGGAYLNGARTVAPIRAVAAATKTVYRIPLAGANTLENSYWMEFADIDTDVLRAPIVNDSHERIYWASPSTGLKYAPKARIIAGQTGFLVGTPAPTTAPTITLVAGTGELDPETGLNVAPKVTRSYTVTFVNEYGEEGQPGPTVEGNGHTDQDWLIESIPQPGSPGQRAAFSKIRLWRTVTGLTGGTAFYKVADLELGTTFYNDRLSDETVSAQSEMISTIWAPPPEGMQGLIAMPNGIFVGWKDNNLYFSENYRPHAWPAEYTITLDFPVVGCGVFGNTLVACTRGTPYAISGVKSAGMASSKIDAPLPCLSRRSIVSAPEGVYFASEEGLVRIGPGGTGVLTAELISREQWRNEYAPSTIRAMISGGVYFAARTVAGEPSEGFSLHPMNPPLRGVSKFDLATSIVNVGVEPWTGKPWVIGSDAILYEWEKPGAEPLSYLWRSKEFQYPQPTNFAVYQAYFDGSAGTGRVLHLKVFVTLRGNDGATSRVLVYDQDIESSGREVKLPSGFKSDIWEFEFSGTAELQSFLAASSVRELRGA